MARVPGWPLPSLHLRKPPDAAQATWAAAIDSMLAGLFPTAVSVSDRRAAGAGRATTTRSVKKPVAPR